MKIAAHLTLAIALCITIASCSKHGDEPIDFGQGTGSCRLAATGDSAYNRLEYDIYGRVTKIANTTYTYNGNTVVARHNGNSQLLPYGYEVDSFILGNNSKIIVRYGTSTNPNIGKAKDDYNYDAAGLLLNIDHSLNGNLTGSTTYKWAHGDVIEAHDGNDRYYRYDTTRKWQFAMYSNLYSHVYFGLPQYKTTHLLIMDSMVDNFNGPYVERYTYGFDVDGKIASDTMRNVWFRSFHTYTDNYHYSCD